MWVRIERNRKGGCPKWKYNKNHLAKYGKYYDKNKIGMENEQYQSGIAVMMGMSMEVK